MSVSMLSTFVKPMHPEGRKFVAIAAAITLVLFALWEPLGWIGTGLTVWVYYFFRDPERVTPDRAGVMVSPADGVVSLLEPATPPAELGLGEAPMTRISVFMSVFNCHVNRIPAAGRITAVAYHEGKFLNASLDKASTDNERNGIAVELPDGRKYGALGLVRVACSRRPGRRGVCRGDRTRRSPESTLPAGPSPPVRVACARRGWRAAQGSRAYAGVGPCSGRGAP